MTLLLAFLQKLHYYIVLKEEEYDNENDILRYIIMRSIAIKTVLLLCLYCFYRILKLYHGKKLTHDKANFRKNVTINLVLLYIEAVDSILRYNSMLGYYRICGSALNIFTKENFDKNNFGIGTSTCLFDGAVWSILLFIWNTLFAYIVANCHSG